MNITQTPFGSHNNINADLYTLENDNGMTVKITNYGGIVTSIIVPDSHGRRSDIVCGFDTLEGYFSDVYQANAPYFGAIIGRCAGRIKDGRFTLNDQTYTLDCNDGPNHLHGGLVGFDKKLWDAQPDQQSDACVLTLTLESPDGDQGYPGTLQLSVEYRLTQNNELAIRYRASTDKATPLALSNHTYFNLNSFQDTILNHSAQILSDYYLIPDSSNVPTGPVQSTINTPCDFNTLHPLADAFNELPNGFEHYYIFTNSSATCQTVARFSDPLSGRSLEVDTTEPGMLFYTGFYTSDQLHREDGTAYGRFRAFCCETAKYPNSPNITNAPRAILLPGQSCDETTVFRLKW